MRKTLSFLLTLLLILPSANVFATLEISNTGTNLGIGTTTPQAALHVIGAIISTNTGGGSYVGGDHSRISFDLLSNGAMRFGSLSNTNNESVDVDLETTANTLAETSITGVIHRTWPTTWDLSFGKALIGGVVGGTTSSYDDTAALVSFFKMEGTTGTSVVDAQSYATCTSSRDISNWTAAGKINNGFTFVSASSDNFTCTGANLAPTGDVTIRGWIRSASFNSNGHIAGNRSATGLNVGYEVYVSSSNKFVMLMDTGATVASVTSSTTLAINTWYAFVAKRSGNTISLKINNSTDGTPTGSLPGDLGTNAGTFQVGRTPITAVYWNGQLDNLQVFNAITTDASDSGFYNSGTGTDATSGTSGSGTQDVGLAVGTSSGVTSAYLTSPTHKDALIEDRIAALGNIYSGGNIISTGNIGVGTTTVTGGGLIVLNGNVGIGTWVPGSKLQVNGLYATNVGIGTTGSGATSCACKTFSGGICIVIGACI